MYCQYLRIKTFQRDSIIFSRFNSEKIERARQMTDQEEIFNPGKLVFGVNNQERKSWAVGEKTVRDLWLCFCPKFL